VVKPRILLLGAPLVVAALLAGCSSPDPSPNGPLGDGGTPGQQCEPAATGQWDAMGIFDLHNASHSPVTITGFTLPHLHGLRVTSAWLTPIGYSGKTEELIGTARWPPITDAVWAHRFPLIGAVIKPGRDYNLVFGLAHTGVKYGTSDGPKISYTSGGSKYTVSEQTTLAVATNCNSVPD
jgi:hypothetical protein